MRKGFWKHKRGIDAFIEVLHSGYSGSDYTKIKIRWWVKTKYGEPYTPFPGSSWIRVKHKDIKDWEVYKPVVEDDPIEEVNRVRL